MNKVWITGVSAVTPLGSGFPVFADNLLAGKSGIRRITFPGESGQRQYVAGCIDAIPVTTGEDDHSTDSLSRFERLMFACTSAALEDAGIPQLLHDERAGLVLGSGAEWLRTWEEDYHKGGNRVLDPQQDKQSAANAIVERHHITGPSLTVAAACASGNVALSYAKRWIELGWVDVCLVGACELVSPLSMGAFDKLRAVSRSSADPIAASRPFDSNRDGFVIGEGGSFLVLESSDIARRRGARAYAELAGYGASSDAFHSVAPNTDHTHTTAAIKQALEDAQIIPEDIDYVNAHATSTPIGDISEACALRAALGPAIQHIPVSSTKSMTGHLLSAASAIEAVACIVALQRQAAPPTINLDDPDPQCNLCHVPHQAREMKIRTVLSNAFGFGGSNTCLVLRNVA